MPKIIRTAVPWALIDSQFQQKPRSRLQDEAWGVNVRNAWIDHLE